MAQNNNLTMNNIPMRLIQDSVGHILSVVMKNGTIFRGRVVDFNKETMNVSMDEVTETNSKGVAKSHDSVYIKGNHVKYVVLPEAVAKHPILDIVAENAKQAKIRCEEDRGSNRFRSEQRESRSSNSGYRYRSEQRVEESRSNRFRSEPRLVEENRGNSGGRSRSEKRAEDKRSSNSGGRSRSEKRAEDKRSIRFRSEQRAEDKRSSNSGDRSRSEKRAEENRSRSEQMAKDNRCNFGHRYRSERREEENRHSGGRSKSEQTARRL